MNPRNEIENRSLTQAFRDDIKNREKRIFRQYFSLSLYGRQIERVLRSFGSNQLMVIDLAKLNSDFLNTMYSISEFVGLKGLSEFATFKISKEVVGSTQSFDRSRSLELKKFNAMDYKIRVSEEFESELIEFYASDVSLLSRITGTQMSWSSKYL